MSTLPKGWIETTLGDIANVVTDYVANGSFASLKENVTYKQEKDFARLIRLVDYNKNYKGDAIYVDENSYTFLKKSQLEPNDIIISNVGEYSGTVFRAPKLNMPMTLGPNAILVKFSNDDFMYYFLKSNIGQYLINTIKSGSANPKFNKTDFKKIKLTIPESPSEQKEIANILSSFDKKIELLKEQNQTLETMAQTIFKEWFIDFNYPNATDEMIDSEMGEIPKGWRVFKLEELVNTVNGYSYKGNELVDESTEALVTLKSFNRNGGFQTRGFKPFQGTPKKEQEVVIGDLIVAHTDLTQDAEVLGNPAFVFENGGFHKMYITMDLVKVNSKVQEIQNSFLYYVMKDKRFKGHCVGYSNGTTVLHLSKKAIPEYKIALPENLKLAQDFSNLTENFTKKISHNILEIKNLEEIKDSLLPKLMSGQKRVFKYDN